MTLLKIAGGRVVDPANGVEDAVGDLWIRDDRIVAAPEDRSERPDRTIDASGLVVMPGGVDMHCHIAGSKVNAARILRPEETRKNQRERTRHNRHGFAPSCVPSTRSTGYSYAGLGYTTAVDAAIPPLGARQAHLELDDTPVIDKAILILLGNNHYAMQRIRDGETARLRDYIAWLLQASGAFGVKLVDPGGVELWKQGKKPPAILDDAIDGFGVTPRRIFEAIASAVDHLAIPHPVHLHGLNLGLPGNAAITLETMQALDGHRAHMAHIQFHSYGGSPENTRRFDSKVAMLADYVNSHPNLSVDVGQVMFGETTSMTADSPVGYFLHKVTGRKWVSHDVEQETGCGVVPIVYEEKNFVHALQFSIGLEWFLRVNDPWQVALSTDHPNGGSFLAYPQLIALLMDRGHRADVLARLPDRVRARSGLQDLSREYSLSEIAIITRAGPAKLLGLANKGHLGPGADADVAIYDPGPDKARMFALPRHVIKAGEFVVENGEPRETADGRTLVVEPGYDAAIEPDIAGWFDRHASLRFRNYGLADGEIAHRRVIPIKADAS